ncbi:hypothetical protein KP79_PYT15602 [Mizuhopecten yessoensis]|uniref:Uncharacterized protein n=1 Tax=Mizuhopecten yessoensis TaxID=6573 RepID=A0A210QFM6_MIZYE|nr:hypothetical protein KP79_PYT15602 [Mizuhopecten yessoensis]
MKHNIQSLGSEGEPFCKIPRNEEINIFEKPLSDSILKRKQYHVQKSTTNKRKHDTEMMVDKDVACEAEAKRRKTSIKEEIGSAVPYKVDGDASEIEMVSSNEHLAECQTEKCEFTCYNFWRLPLPDFDLCEIG